MSRALVTAAVVMSGNELLDGRVRDVNGAWLCADLSERGVKLLSVHTVTDVPAQLAAALGFALAQAPDLLIVSGGLGATHDDLTAAALAEVLHVRLEENALALAMVQGTLRLVAERRGVPLAGLVEQGRRQALLPAGSAPLAPAGVAPGIAARRGPTRIYALPGVPHEFRVMWRAIAGELAAEGYFPPVASRTLRVFGCGETAVATVLQTVSFDLLELGVTAASAEVAVRLRYPAGDAAAAEQATAVVAALEAALPVFADDGRTVVELVGDELTARGETLAVAESCTGGALGAGIVARPGSSAYFRGGVIAYANGVKEDLLDVPPPLLAELGAVSSEVAAAMAEGVRRRCAATYGLSVTGIAGPDGGTPEKPVGLVFLGCAGPRGTRVVRERFPGDREAVRAQSVTRALHLLREELRVDAAGR